MCACYFGKCAKYPFRVTTHLSVPYFVTNRTEFARFHLFDPFCGEMKSSALVGLMFLVGLVVHASCSPHHRILSSKPRKYSPDVSTFIVADVCGSKETDLKESYAHPDDNTQAYAGCCSNEIDSATGLPKSGFRKAQKKCSGRVTKGEAEAFCRAGGGRLCNLTELSSQCSTGCNLDHRLIWTSEEAEGCADRVSATQASCEYQLKFTQNCTLRRDGNITDGYCSRTCGLW